jgi:hypothetical protein
MPRRLPHSSPIRFGLRQGCSVGTFKVMTADTCSLAKGAHGLESPRGFVVVCQYTCSSLAVTQPT